MSRTFSEFSEFRDSDKSLKHELGSIKDPVSNMCVSNTRVCYVAGSSHFTVITDICVPKFI